MTRERIRWQMEKFCAGGIYNLVIINLAPAGPIVGAMADDPEWFSEEWWARFIDACTIAQELGMRIWFYDQIGFSGANVQGSVTNVQPEAAGLALRHRIVPADGTPIQLSAGESLVGAYAPDGARLAVTADGMLPVAEGTEVLLATSIPTAFDYLNPTAVDALIDKIHGEFDRRVPQFLGSVIAGSFQDELPATNSWTSRFADEFRTRRGYDLLEELPALWIAGGSHSAKVRGDYYAVRGELTEEALFKPLGTWHTDRGMLIGSDQSNPARAGNPTQATQIYTDYFRTHRWYGAAGSDHEGDAKVHSSMAHLYGYERVWIESFHSSGWGGTLEDTYDWLLPFLRSGANLYNPHASYFGTAGGWFEWAPPSTDWRQPYWKQYPAFSRAIARMASMLSWGTYSAEVAVLHPTATAQALLTLDSRIDHFGDGQIGGEFADVDETQRVYLELCGANNWFITKPGALDSAGIAFDIIDDSSLQRADVASATIRLAGLSYSTIILPGASVLEAGTATALLAFLDGGGRVILVGRVPDTIAGVADDDALAARVATHERAIRVATSDEAIAAVPRDDGYAVSDIQLLVRRSGLDSIALVTGAFPNASAYPLRKTSDWLWDDYDFDSARYARTRTVTVAASVAEAEVWDPATGVQHPARVTVDGGISTIEVDLAGAPAVLLVWREGEATVVAPTPAPTWRQIEQIGEGWSGSLVPTMDNEWGDMALPAGSSVAGLEVWSLDWAETDGEAPTTWTRTKVTSGERVRTLGPLSPDDAPAPLTPAEVSSVLNGTSDLAGGAWTTVGFSGSRGLEKQPFSPLGTKALLPEEFVLIPPPTGSEVGIIRAIIRTDRLGSADLIIGAGAPKRVWWNGEELTVTGTYSSTARIEISSRDNVLEYRLGATENIPGISVVSGPAPLGSFFLLVEPGGYGERPEFMYAGADVVPVGATRYSRTFSLESAATDAGLVVGAATGLTVLLDGEVVSRQEKVEYYETSWGATPMFFEHDVRSRLTAGTHSIEIVADTSDARDVVFVDLVAETATGVVAIVSGAGWDTSAESATAPSRERRGHWSELASSHAALRTHPLRDAAWLHGVPAVGAEADRVQVTDSVVPATQWYRVVLPAGTTEVTVPVRFPTVVSIDGVESPLDNGRIRLDSALERPTETTLRIEQAAFGRAGAAFRGPLLVTMTEAPIALGDWRSIGLDAWSGGVRYRRTVNLPSVDSVALDLGHVRGSVEVSVDGELIGEAFCAPFRFDLGTRSGEVELEITVFNTLAPFFWESTATIWVFPSQLESGLTGPVSLEYSALEHAAPTS